MCNQFNDAIHIDNRYIANIKICFIFLHVLCVYDGIYDGLFVGLQISDHVINGVGFIIRVHVFVEVRRSVHISKLIKFSGYI